MQFPKKFEKIRAHERDFMSYAIAGQKRNMTLVVLNKYLNYVANFRYVYLQMSFAIIFVGDFCLPRPLQLKYTELTSAPRDRGRVTEHKTENSVSYVLFLNSVWVLLTSHTSAVSFIALLLED